MLGTRSELMDLEGQRLAGIEQKLLYGLIVCLVLIHSLVLDWLM